MVSKPIIFDHSFFHLLWFLFILNLFLILLSFPATMSSSSADHSLPMNTLIHMITIKLSCSNYLMWKNQMLYLFAYQNLLPHIDDSSVAPSLEILIDDKSSPNLLYTAWTIGDQRAVYSSNLPFWGGSRWNYWSSICTSHLDGALDCLQQLLGWKDPKLAWPTPPIDERCIFCCGIYPLF